MAQTNTTPYLTAAVHANPTSLPIRILIVFFGLRNLDAFGALVTDKIIAFFRVSRTGRSRSHRDWSRRSHRGSMMQMGIVHDFRCWRVFGQGFLSRNRYYGGSGQRGNGRFIELIIPAKVFVLWLLCRCDTTSALDCRRRATVFTCQQQLASFLF